MLPVFALVDCNNFYVSCERVFNSKLLGKPVIVLSNNDGCAIARSDEAKALGIKMGVPVFQILNIIKAHKVHVYSSNYALYGDMSQRVIQALTQFSPNIEIYSIDESFLDLSGFSSHNRTEYGRKIKYTVEKWTGIPVSIGIAETKTLAKIANRIAKKSKKPNGVLDLTASPYQDKALELIDVEDVWGIGRSYSRFLKENGIKNALQLRDANDWFIKKRMGIVGTRLLHELRGISRYPLERCPSPKRGITVSRSFKQTIGALAELLEAVAGYVSIGTKKLRKEHSVAGALIVFLMTNRFKKERYYYNMTTIRLPVPTSDTSELIQYAHRGLTEIYKKGYLYKKAGVMFTDLAPETQVQTNFLDSIDRIHSNRLMKALDNINEKMGSSTLKYAAVGLSGKKKWQTVFNHRSRSYTTNWNQLLEVS